jgi:hypothetical protein
MAYDKIEQVRELDADFLLLQACAAVRVPVCVYYAQEDGWIGIQRREVMLDVLQGMRCHFERG